MSRIEREIRALWKRLPPDSSAESRLLLEQLVLEYLPCLICLEAYVTTILAWRESGLPNPPGRDPGSLGTLWGWSGGNPFACRSHCRINHYLRTPPSTILGGTWRGMRIEFQAGYGPKAVVDEWNAIFRRTKQGRKRAAG
jgi:hypothetical protein